MMTTDMKADCQAVVKAIREHDNFVIATHENPDGDALGSMLAVELVLEQLGKSSTMFLPGTGPIPFEYRFMALGEMVRGEPGELIGRSLIAVDAANGKTISPRIYTPSFIIDKKAEQQILKGTYPGQIALLKAQVKQAIHGC